MKGAVLVYAGVARSTPSPIVWATIIGGILAALTVGLIVVSALRSFAHTCEVCMTFRGETECRSASGRTAEEATRTAIDNACALVGARGMTLSIECQNTKPASVSCDAGG
jgi:hypothetical protein